jgi:hypothetical protein
MNYCVDADAPTAGAKDARHCQEKLFMNEDTSQPPLKRFLISNFILDNGL